jgi:flagellin
MSSIDVTRIRGNVGAMNALNSLKQINDQLAIHQTRLASGKQINSASDDPAGLSIATRMLSRSEGLKVALNNIGDSKNLLSVAESGMSNINDILVQMRNKAETGASDTMGDSERTAIKTQLEAYAAQINDIADQTKWNDTQLIGSSTAKSLRLQTGVDKNDFTTLDSLGDMHATGSLLNIGTTKNTAALSGTDAHIGTMTATADVKAGDYSVSYTYDSGTKTVTASLLDSDGKAVGNSQSVDLSSGDKAAAFSNGLSVNFTASAFSADITTAAKANVSVTSKVDLGLDDADAAGYADYMDTVQKAIDTVNEHLSSIGAITGRLTFKEDQVTADQTNVEAAYNRIMNADMADEQVAASKYKILQQTATAMLAQANTAPQFLLSLFQ